MLRVMRSAITTVLLVVLASVTGLTQAVAAPTRMAVVRHQGRDFVNVSTWASANGLYCSWLKRGELLGLRKGTTQITLRVDSRAARVNGLNVWLLYPATMIKGFPMISVLDTETTLQPLLKKTGLKPGAKVRTICLDAGHGGKDPGHRSLGYNEKALTLLLTQELSKQLVRAGYKVTFTRRTDAFVDLPVRPALARKQKADLFISLHFNAAESSRSPAQGCEVYCLTPAGAPSTNAQGEGANTGSYPGNRNNAVNIQLAFQTQQALVQSLGVTDRGLRRARFAVLRDATMPAILIEAGFLSHPTEGRKILSAQYRQKIAIAIVKGISQFTKN
jgi:N-acetylmuramoyl-L-alanine amidase